MDNLFQVFILPILFNVAVTFVAMLILDNWLKIFVTDFGKNVTWISSLTVLAFVQVFIPWQVHQLFGPGRSILYFPISDFFFQIMVIQMMSVALYIIVWLLISFLILKGKKNANDD
jgi:hypothetical protein